jgi:hypothetical protein
MANKAQQTITIEFQARGERKLTNAIMLLDKASKSLTNTQRRLIDDTKNLTNAQDRQRKSTRILGGTFATIRSKLLLFNFAMALGVRQLGKFAVQASKVESMSNAFNTLSGAGEDSREALQRLEQATNGTMSQFDLFQQANNAMVLGVSRNSEEMAEMFDIAQRLGRALGRDTASSVESLVTGIGRQSRLMLDNIGIIVKSDEAYESYAKTLGVNVEQLTDAEKKQAFLNATMESARAKVKTLGDETFTSQDVYDQLSSATTNLATATGDLLAPRMTQMAKFFTNVAKSATDYFNALTLGNQRITESTSKEQAMLILLSRRKNIQSELSSLTNQTSIVGLRQDKLREESKKKLKEVDEKLLQLNLGNMNAIIDLNNAKKEENKTDEDAVTTGLYRVEIAQQELDIIRNKNEALKNGLNIQEQLSLLDDEMILNQLRKNNGDITEQEFKKKDLELTGKKISLEEKLGEMTIKSAGQALTALSAVASQNKSNAQLAKDLALAGAFIDMYAGMNKAFQQEGALGFLTGTAIFAQGMANIAQIQAQKFQEGGLVGGRLHSQGGTMIEAEKGEFVMSRNAVQSIGTETLNQMNQTGNAGVTVNISAPLVDETVVDTIIPAIEKAQRMNLA